jgi:hypothetical protein
MACPNRSAEVRALCVAHPEAFPSGADNDPARLRLLREVLIPALYRLDGGRWGFMTKTDQRLAEGGYKVPCDVLMWEPTGDVIDCMTGTGACWIPHDPPPPAWVWTAVDEAPPAPPDPPPGPDNPPPAPPPDRALLHVRYLQAVVALAEGTVEPMGDGQCVLRLPTGKVVSVTPPVGGLETRDAIGAWELATRIGLTLLRYDGTGIAYYLIVHPVE